MGVYDVCGCVWCVWCVDVYDVCGCVWCVWCVWMCMMCMMCGCVWCVWCVDVYDVCGCVWCVWMCMMCVDVYDVCGCVWCVWCVFVLFGAGVSRALMRPWSCVVWCREGGFHMSGCPWSGRPGLHSLLGCRPDKHIPPSIKQGRGVLVEREGGDLLCYNHRQTPQYSYSKWLPLWGYAEVCVCDSSVNGCFLCGV